MLHQAMLTNASFDVENSKDWLLFVPFSQAVLKDLSVQSAHCIVLYSKKIN